MLKIFPHFIAACIFATPCFTAPLIGVQTLAQDSNEQGRSLSLSVWYPAQAGGTLENVGGNAVFVGSSIFRNAPVSDAIFPLVLLSHGGLRSAEDSGAWLSKRLVQAGFMVVEINGPRPRRASEAVDEIWRRPEDVSRALDRILDDPVWSAVVDQKRISVVGQALGGTAALALAGGTFEATAYVRSCEPMETGPDCAWYANQEVSLVSVNTEALERSHGDSRINATVSIDPEYSEVFSSGSLKKPDSSFLLIELGNHDDVWPKDGGMLDLPHVLIADATGFDVFPVCTKKGKVILAEDGGDPALCQGVAADRDRIHSQVAKHIVSFLTK